MPSAHPRSTAINERKPHPLTTTRALGIGLELGASVGGLALLGWFGDAHWGTGPWLALTGSLVGLIGGVYNVIRSVRRYTR